MSIEAWGLNEELGFIVYEREVVLEVEFLEVVEILSSGLLWSSVTSSLYTSAPHLNVITAI